jgi:hypothetical protein
MPLEIDETVESPSGLSEDFDNVSMQDTGDMLGDMDKLASDITSQIDKLDREPSVPAAATSLAKPKAAVAATSLAKLKAAAAATSLAKPKAAAAATSLAKPKASATATSVSSATALQSRADARKLYMKTYMQGYRAREKTKGKMDGHIKNLLGKNIEAHAGLLNVSDFIEHFKNGHISRDLFNAYLVSQTELVVRAKVVAKVVPAVAAVETVFVCFFLLSLLYILSFSFSLFCFFCSLFLFFTGRGCRGRGCGGRGCGGRGCGGREEGRRSEGGQRQEEERRSWTGLYPFLILAHSLS